MKIRKANERDIEQLAVLNTQVQAVHANLFPALFRDRKPDELHHLVRDMLNDVNTVVLVAEEQGQLLGYVKLEKRISPEHLLIHERKCGYIDQVCVSEQHRQRGVFNALLAEARKVVLDWGFNQIELDVWSENKVAKDTFTRCGFKTFNEKMKMNF